MPATTTGGVARLRAPSDVARVLGGRRQRAGWLLAVHIADGPEPTPRVAVVASRRVGSAVARNRSKRLLREASRVLRWRPGVDAVLVARAPSTASSLADVAAELERLARQLGALEEGD